MFKSVIRTSFGQQDQRRDDSYPDESFLQSLDVTNKMFSMTICDLECDDANDVLLASNMDRCLIDECFFV